MIELNKLTNDSLILESVALKFRHFTEFFSLKESSSHVENEEEEK